MKTHATIAAAAISLGLGLAAAAGSAGATTVYGVDGNDRLVTFDSNLPGVFKTSVQITGATGIFGLDFRPLTRQLYGLASDRTVYVIDSFTGVATAQGGVLDLGAGSTHFAFDFNPTIDRLRIVTNGEVTNNFVFNPLTNGLTTATNVFYRAGDLNVGKPRDVIASAYTSSVFGAPAGTTQLYSLDAQNGVLTKQANSAGTLDTVGSLGVSIGLRSSFDIAGNDAFVQDGRNFYGVNLATGKLTLKGRTDEALFGIAIAPAPEPATWGMMIAGFGMAGATLRRRRVIAVKA